MRFGECERPVLAVLPVADDRIERPKGLSADERKLRNLWDWREQVRKRRPQRAERDRAGERLRSDGFSDTGERLSTTAARLTARGRDRPPEHGDRRVGAVRETVPREAPVVGESLRRDGTPGLAERVEQRQRPGRGPNGLRGAHELLGLLEGGHENARPLAVGLGESAGPVAHDPDVLPRGHTTTDCTRRDRRESSPRAARPVESPSRGARLGPARPMRSGGGAGADWSAVRALAHAPAMTLALTVSNSTTIGDLIVGGGTALLALFTGWLGFETRASARAARAAVEGAEEPFVIATATDWHDSTVRSQTSIRRVLGEAGKSFVRMPLWNIGHGPAIVEQVSLDAPGHQSTPRGRACRASTTWIASPGTSPSASSSTRMSRSPRRAGRTCRAPGRSRSPTGMRADAGT